MRYIENARAACKSLSHLQISSEKVESSINVKLDNEATKLHHSKFTNVCITRMAARILLFGHHHFMRVLGITRKTPENSVENGSHT